MQEQLDSLGQEIELKRSTVNHYSQTDVDAFNLKVRTYNGLVEKVREQNSYVNTLIDRYNAKLSQYGR